MYKKPPTKKMRVDDSSKGEEIICDVDIPSDLNDYSFADYDDMSSLSDSSLDEDPDLDVDSCSTASDTNNIHQSSDSWSEEDLKPVLHDFEGEEGLKVDISPNSTTFDLFSLLFGQELLEKIVEWTNLNAKTSDSGPPSTESNSKNWKNVSFEEMKKFLGLCIVMGNIRMPNLKMYWSNDVLYFHPLFGKTMGRNRFELILRYLRFHDEQTCDVTNRLHKVDQVLNHVMKNIQNVYYPGENLTVNNGLLLWKGRLLGNKASPFKKCKFGIKIYELCTLDGFVLNFTTLSGKELGKRENDHAFGVAYSLLENYLGKGHTVYLDSFYNSVDLTASLYNDRTHVVGKLRRNQKGNPKFVVEKKLKKRECVFARNGSILVQKWKGVRDVLIITTKHNVSDKEIKYKNGKYVKRPAAVADYITHMSGTDRIDQMVFYSSSPRRNSSARKSLPWHIKLFFHIIDITIWNACWLYNKTHLNSMNYFEFRNDLAKKLLNIDCPTSVVPASNTPETQHFPKKLNRRLRCRICGIKKLRKETSYSCGVCTTNKGSPIGLCIDECFKKFHEKK